MLIVKKKRYKKIDSVPILSHYSNLLYLVPTMSMLALIILGLVCINPISNSAYAVDSASASSSDNTLHPSDYSSLSFRISSNNKLSSDGNVGYGELSDGDTISTEVVPGVVNYIGSNITITTKNINKFYVGVQAAEGSSSELTGTIHTNEKIVGVGSNVAPQDFNDNTWGFSISDGSSNNTTTATYSTLPTYSDNTNVQYTSASNLGDGDHNINLTFAAKINANKPADHYTTTAMVSIAADAKSITLSNITYMQDMTSDICRNSQENETKQLIDSRDDKTYWVTKLKDGNCWMTQNLDYDDPNSTRIDDPSNWNSNLNGPEIPNSARIYYDPGLKIVQGNTLVDATAESDTHYLIGNYYSWNSAMNGSGTTLINFPGDAPDSICPEKWQLPIGGRETVNDKEQLITVNKTTTALFEAYGYEFLSSDYVDSGPYSPLTAESDVFKAPLYFVRNGATSTSAWFGVGLWGNIWLSTLASQGNAYFTSVNIVYSLTPAYINRPEEGQSIRCIAK